MPIKNTNSANYRPEVIDWASVELPDTWPDHCSLYNPLHLYRMLRAVLGSRQKIQIPHNLPGRNLIPKYALQEFHNLPNGNYSQKLSNGYIKGFEIVMLGCMTKYRKMIASSLNNCNSVLDIGCGGGTTADIIQQKGIDDVWALDPCPYLLKKAATRHPKINFIQGAGENIPFQDSRFDGVSLCYVLHEIPPKHVEEIILEVKRILKPGGSFVIVEPSPIHYFTTYRKLFRHFGLKGLYFKLLAHNINEPFLESWHKINLKSLLISKGFQVVQELSDVPSSLIHVKSNK
ncbi:MAG: ubiquinone/menaquinone biosynthesis C-methylase UbiE [Paracoccaceae bacterium]|jgi:ubiquinone/menaquinone biosynthesis C-methylase UbiE